MKAIVFAVLAGLCWGVGEIFTKGALNTAKVGPLTALLVRTLVTLPLAFLAYLIASNVWKTEPAGWWRDLTPSIWAQLILGSGVLAGFAGVFFFYLGLGSPGGDISKIRPIAFALAPATAVLLGWAVLHEGMSVRKGIACVLIMIGIIMLAGEGHKASETPKEPPTVR